MQAMLISSLESILYLGFPDSIGTPDDTMELICLTQFLIK